MLSARPHGIRIIVVSFIIALMLTVMPLPDWALPWRPAWVAMVLIYWCMALPERVSIGIGWLAGLIMDVQTGTLLGQHALAFSILAYVIVSGHRRLRVFPLLKQACLICVYVLLLQIFTLWVQGMMGIPLPDWSFWMPAVTSMLLWPWLFILLRDARRKFQVS
ncbi:MAG: rod shape-determining protein MreD [Gammaproteobacteria bacterium]